MAILSPLLIPIMSPLLTLNYSPPHSLHCRLLFRYFIVVQLISCIWLFVNPWTAACQASLPKMSFTISWNLLKLMSIELVMRSNHLILCHLLLFLPSIIPSIRVFSNEAALCVRWPKYWSFNFSISLSNQYSGLISFRIDYYLYFSYILGIYQRCSHLRVYILAVYFTWYAIIQIITQSITL